MGKGWRGPNVVLGVSSTESSRIRGQKVKNPPPGRFFRIHAFAARLPSLVPRKPDATTVNKHATELARSGDGYCPIVQLVQTAHSPYEGGIRGQRPLRSARQKGGK